MKKILFVLALSLFISCGKDKETDFAVKKVKEISYAAKNDQDIIAYVAKNKLKATKSSTGLYYVINETGKGIHPAPASTVRVAYKGYYTNGVIFDQSTTTGISFTLYQVINGWKEGITYFREGGSGILLVPAHLGYGNYDYNGIPGGSVLIFDIKLISVN
ncbi:FKBP-type peptidyl-prolyl cis-trans isomerase [Flavobacterium sp. K5-23]|uniref:FKBP-type peptidyl-prolyl cis-trans isomerase n=1 Tax=Flavobacterium sp. K5-23 TaxID=2746225 RepID=UPI00200C0E83|nr:FKBP-type peptidyl-prolyl cis-trans isomerase [Flavobacterium sp. K5-23]UQD55524.1 FKBP-type peptidyl-prolyl cis-trans isomerase [Flavobacterium sp. K5-23]